MPHEASFIFRFTVPEVSRFHKCGLVFTKWLPLGSQNSVVISETDRRLEIRFDEYGGWARDKSPPADELAKTECARVAHLTALVDVHNIDADVYSGVVEWSSENEDLMAERRRDEAINRPHLRFAAQLTEWVVDRVNRVLQNARDDRAQWCPPQGGE